MRRTEVRIWWLSVERNGDSVRNSPEKTAVDAGCGDEREWRDGDMKTSGVYDGLQGRTGSEF